MKICRYIKEFVSKHPADESCKWLAVPNHIIDSFGHGTIIFPYYGTDLLDLAAE